MFLAFAPAAFAQTEGALRQEGLVTMVTGAGPVVQLVLYILDSVLRLQLGDHLLQAPAGARGAAAVAALH